MGTNYYHVTNKCEHCGRDDRRHIGKSSAGWTFSFRGHNNVISFEDWKREFKNPGQIVDEYDNRISVGEFEHMVGFKMDGTNHTDLYPDGHWKDEEGHSFSDNEFS